MKDKIRRICLWSGPRNISTALMYSFAQRTDTKVFDEPLYGYYLDQTDADEYHPGAEEIKANMELNGDKVVDMMLSQHKKPVLFFKNMTHHLLDLDRGFLKEVTNILLTRDPVEMLPSFHKVIPNPSLKDVGYKDHTELVDWFSENEIKPIVIDATTFLKNPEKLLQKLCLRIGIPFQQNMLFWEKGAIAEDGVWAKYWYKNVHNSTGFMKYKPKSEPFPKELEPLLDECMPHYKKLIEFAL